MVSIQSIDDGKFLLTDCRDSAVNRKSVNIRLRWFQSPTCFSMQPHVTMHSQFIYASRKAYTFLLSLCPALCGCTQIDLTNQSTEALSLQSGTLNKTPVLIDTRGLGIIIGKQHVTLGWMDETFVMFPDPKACSLLVYVRDARILSEVGKQLKAAGLSGDSLCIAGGTHDSKS